MVPSTWPRFDSAAGQLLNVNSLGSHPDFRKVACSLCGKKVHELKKHMLTHTDQRPYSCENCQKGFTSRYALKIHKRQHTNERPYICSHCAMDFLRNSNLFKLLALTDNGVSLFKITCSKWGGRIGGPLFFSQGL
ncbi:hypothetical protein HUJ04_009691 [Dendroctonus ponderosae]|nr:hypothetical protein HUJ04_009691 [Dendroctonus ponderosae]